MMSAGPASKFKQVNYQIEIDEITYCDHNSYGMPVHYSRVFHFFSLDQFSIINFPFYVFHFLLLLFYFELVCSYFFVSYICRSVLGGCGGAVKMDMVDWSVPVTFLVHFFRHSLAFHLFYYFSYLN